MSPPYVYSHRVQAQFQLEHLADHLRRLHVVRGLQSRSIARHLATCRVLFRFLRAEGLVQEDPSRLLEAPTRWKRLPIPFVGP